METMFVVVTLVILAVFGGGKKYYERDYSVDRTYVLTQEETEK